MLKTIKIYLPVIKNQLIIIGFLLFFKILVFFKLIPNEQHFISILNDFFLSKGLWAVVASSLLENIIGFGAYFPGSVVILTAMSLTGGNIQRGILTFACILIPSIIAHCINFYLGRKLTSKRESSKKSLFTYLFSTLWHPHLGATTTFALGSSGISFIYFLSYFLPIHFVWNLFWGVVMFNIGVINLSGETWFAIFYIYLLLWILWDLRKKYNEQLGK